jgi:hypothetical protein
MENLTNAYETTAFREAIDAFWVVYGKALGLARLEVTDLIGTRHEHVTVLKMEQSGRCVGGVKMSVSITFEGTLTAEQVSMLEYLRKVPAS